MHAVVSRVARRSRAIQPSFSAGGQSGNQCDLNIAESNGRYPEADRRKFLDIAESSAVKAAAYLDLCQSKAELDAEQKERGIELLGRVALMLWGLASS